MRGLALTARTLPPIPPNGLLGWKEMPPAPHRLLAPVWFLIAAPPRVEMPEDDEEAAARERAQRYIKFGTVTEKNVEQLRKLNLAVFPVR